MKNSVLHNILFLLLLVFISNSLTAQRVMLLQQGHQTSIRGLSVVDDSIAWISGSKGSIAITRDGGKDWNWQQVKGFENADFRDIEAFSSNEAVIMSSGTPALVLKTTDGGQSWQVKYRNIDSAYFFDAMDFSDKSRGYILGDPIGNKFLIMETKDGGETWTKLANPPNALPGEASFAASGTCLRIVNKKIYIVSGGIDSRLITNFPKNGEWNYINIPLIHGKSSEGAFSLAMGSKSGIIVGGDYAKDKNADSVSAISSTTTFPVFKIAGYGPGCFQSCVEYISDETFLSTGTPGSYFTPDGGKKWIKIDAASYNVCRRAKRGKLVLLAGNGGRIGILKM